MLFQDIEEPGALHHMSQIRTHWIILCTAPDKNSIDMYMNTRASIARLGLESNILTLTNSLDTCQRLNVSQCVWSSRFINNKPANSVSLDKFWDWRFKFYYVKKKLFADLVRLNSTVIQADIDAIWVKNPFPVLDRINSSIVVQRDGPFANAGIMYARRWSRAALNLLTTLLGVFNSSKITEYGETNRFICQGTFVF